MTGPGLLRRLLLLAFVLAVVQAGDHASGLPALSAIWFGLDGEALVYVPTARLVWAHVGLAFALTVAFWVLPERLAPPAAPAGAYRGQLDPRARSLREWTWLGIVSVLVVIALAELVYGANRATIPRLQVATAGAVLLAYAGFVVLWAWRRRRAAATRPGG